MDIVLGILVIGVGIVLNGLCLLTVTLKRDLWETRWLILWLGIVLEFLAIWGGLSLLGVGAALPIAIAVAVFEIPTMLMVERKLGQGRGGDSHAAPAG